MSAFSLNFAEAAGFSALPVGQYEAIIKEVEVKEFRTGSKGLKLTYVIRNDVNQEGRGRKIFDNFVASEGAMFRFSQLGKAINMQDGRAFASAEDLLGAFANESVGKSVKLTLKVEKYEGNDQNRVALIEPSELNNEDGLDIPAEGLAVDIPDEDLPWEQ